MNTRFSSVARTTAIGVALAAAFFAGTAFAASERYDTALDHITKAKAQLNAITPVAGNLHRDRAVERLDQAIEQIGKAKEKDDKPVKPPKP